MSFRIPEGRRSGEWRITHEYRVVWWEITPSPAEPEQWYWKLLKRNEPINGGVTETVQRCMSEANWAYSKLLEGSFCAIQDYDEELGRMTTRLIDTP